MVGIVLTTLFGLLVGCGSTATSAKPPGTPTVHDFSGLPTVGALYRPGSKDHTCTASVVASKKGNILLTAAHCIAGTGHGYTFTPGSHGGIQPFGSWTVLAAYGTPDWVARQAPQSDFAFLVVAARQVNGQGQEIQDLTGANQLAAAPTAGVSVTVPGYPNGHNDPVTCSGPVYYDSGYPTFNCDQYVDGTSGGPWLVTGGQGLLVTGVLGGLHQGGCSWAVYSPAFGAATMIAYANAAAGVNESTFPKAGSSSC